MDASNVPYVALTMGDPAGVGPEVIAGVLAAPETASLQARLIVVGDSQRLERAFKLIGETLPIVRCESIEEAKQSSVSEDGSRVVACWNPSTSDLSQVQDGTIDAQCGAAAYDWLVAATEAAKSGIIDGIVTAPLSKAALHLAGHHYPGHTEILAERCGVTDFAMMLYLPQGEIVRSEFGLGVAHVTLHTSIASVPGLLSQSAVSEKIELIHRFLKRIGAETPRIGVCALNPHGGEGGLFGNEENEIIAPAVEESRKKGIDANGPFPADTLLQRAVAGRFDGVVAMYHDQGHIALKLIGFQKAVNVTLGLPIVRTSPSHGTAYDIAWTNQVDSGGMKEALRVALQLIQTRDSA
ncbi:4-hydroxythreonine-4-phosphate dehydrogenase 2 [Thalassoglobus neptunius]|uniref:4-hydroxythreonine-4-phosphate dehydrogenase 2 n=1 Tax=Thalassoglobus neptunius TaxID=1938619 RepID=A0A5C5X9K3_9PLAN|nr:4-hydroxythreonine-4-phosphate dehydrogenase PdxA [Thalassoglobus neptunius]TWT59071.1 4-hydroxythreonine-4-phosphate dehydrogenase 2 [Thalassoglobus neptunius]